MYFATEGWGGFGGLDVVKIDLQKDTKPTNLGFPINSNKDDFGLPSSSFTICTFWYINSLSKIGKKEEATAQFEQLLSYSNHLGLFSEDIDFETKRLLGNFPQAYSHLALIETALNLTQLEDQESIIDGLS